MWNFCNILSHKCFFTKHRAWALWQEHGHCAGRSEHLDPGVFSPKLWDVQAEEGEVTVLAEKQQLQSVSCILFLCMGVLGGCSGEGWIKIIKINWLSATNTLQRTGSLEQTVFIGTF